MLFLEAGEDFVDTLIGFLLLTVGTILHMLSAGLVPLRPLGEISRGMCSIFVSVKDLDSSLLHVDKHTLVEPIPATGGPYTSTGLLKDDIYAENTLSPSQRVNLPEFFLIQHCRKGRCDTLSTKKGGLCCSKRPDGWNHRDKPMYILPKDLQELEAAIVGDEGAVKKASRSSGKGFVREYVMYLVTDSLEIMPSTTDRSIEVLNKLKVGTLADMESSDITVSIKQVLRLLQSALSSDSCLNDAFGR